MSKAIQFLNEIDDLIKKRLYLTARNRIDFAKQYFGKASISNQEMAKRIVRRIKVDLDDVFQLGSHGETRKTYEEYKCKETKRLEEKIGKVLEGTK